MTPPIPLALTSALSARYRVDRAVGSGGMATVYLAQDLKHDRAVAVKVLRRDVAEAVGAERFLAEIKTTAHLKHPHILPLFDSGSVDGVLFYVMPFIDGESLHQRLQRDGPLPIDQAVATLREIADALAHAHSVGIVHRDVKPDNVLISGRHVFLADFGIARVLAGHQAGDTVTATGLIAGTPAYMAPEQIAGGPVDERTDIYAFGVLACELLTGAPPFTGSAQDVVTAHLTKPPARVTVHRPDVPPALDGLVMRCLEKSAGRRWQRMDELLAELDAIAAGKARVPARWTPVVLAAAAAAAFLAWTMLMNQREEAGSALIVGRNTRITSEPGLELDPALSPDGRTLAYSAGPPGRTSIHLRQLANGRTIALTEGGVVAGQRWPQWSADGTQIVFYAGRAQMRNELMEDAARLYLVPALGGLPRLLFDSGTPRQAFSPSWFPKQQDIVFSGDDGIYAVTAAGKEVPRRLVPGSGVHSPRWSPDGHWLAYVEDAGGFTFGEEQLGNVSTSRLFMQPAGSVATIALTDGNSLDTNPLWMPDSRTLLFITTRGGGRDIFQMQVGPRGMTGDEPQRVTSGTNAHTMSLSADGKRLAYSSYTPSANIWSIPIPSSGVASLREATQLTFGSEKIEKVAVSPDGRWLAFDSDREGQADIWKMPTAGGPAERVTRSRENEFVNDWSPDGRELVIHAMRNGQRDVLVISADGMRVEPVAATPRQEQHAGWGADGNSIVFDAPPAAGERPQAFVATRAKRGEPWGPARQITRNGSNDPKWSPDGRLIAFCADYELRTISPDGSGERVLVSGKNHPDMPEPSYPIWSRDSGTIYYKVYDRARQSSIWSIGLDGRPPRLLVRFDDPSHRSLRREFAADGQRFYFTVARDESDIWVMEIGRNR